MDTEEFDYKTLRKIQEAEKKSPIITRINDNFYEKVTNFINNLQERAGKETNPRKKMLLSEELNNNDKIMVNIYEQREKKIMLAAISKARGGSPNIKNILDSEKSLFDSLFNIFIQSRKIIFNQENNLTIENENNKNKKENEIQLNETDEIMQIEKNKNDIVQITEDIPEFVGTDAKKYNLKKGDILTFPDGMSNMLINGNVAKKLNIDDY